jgi:pimeloyl-ACP methyl ester carboxylesterase
MTSPQILETPDASLAYDVRGPLPTANGRPPLLLIGHPMDAGGFATLASLLPDRTVVTYDPRGLGRSTRHDGRSDSSGGAVAGLALVAAHPGDVATLVAHEPPILGLLPDADRAFAAERDVQAAYHEKGWGHGMAAFIALTAWKGEFPDDYSPRTGADPAAFGLPVDDNGSRDDPLLSGISNAITAFRPDVAALQAAPTRVVIAVGEESEGLLTGRTSIAVAEALGQEPVVFPGGHGGFMGGEFGYQGQPDAFAKRLREVLDAE